MKRFLFLVGIISLTAYASLAQSTPTDFSGTWDLDVSKSKITAPSYIQSMTLTVTQTASELKVVTKMERGPRPAGAPSGPGTGGGMGRGSGFGGGDQTSAYPLDGKESTVEIEGPNGKIPVKYKGSISGGKANLAQSRTFTGAMGEVTMTTKDVWSLSADGKTLTIERESTSPRGTNSSTLVFTKK